MKWLKCCKTSVRAPVLSANEREHAFVWYFGAGWEKTSLKHIFLYSRECKSRPRMCICTCANINSPRSFSSICIGFGRSRGALGPLNKVWTVFSGCGSGTCNRGRQKGVCIVKGEAQKSPLFWQFFGGFWFSQERLFSRNSTRKPFNLIKSPILTNTPCKSTCLYHAPSMYTVEILWRWLIQVVLLLLAWKCTGNVAGSAVSWCVPVSQAVPLPCRRARKDARSHCLRLTRMSSFSASLPIPCFDRSLRIDNRISRR